MKTASFSNPLEMARERLAQRTLIITGLLLPSVINGFLEQGKTVENIATLLLVVVCTTLGFAPVPAKLRRAVIVLSTGGYPLLSGLPIWGFSSGPITILALFALYSTLLYGRKAGLAASFVALLALIVTGTGHSLGYFRVPAPLLDQNNLENWLRSGSAMLVLLVLPVPPIVAFIGEISDAARFRAAALDATIEEEVRRTSALDEHRAAQVEIRNAQRERTLGRMAGGLAHEINGVLQEIEGWIEALERDGPENDREREEAVLEMRDGVRRAAAVGRRLLYVGGKSLPTLKATDLATFLRNLESILVAAVGQRVTIRFEFEEAPPVLVDRTELTHVLVNLVVNSRDAIVRQGNVRILLGPPTAADAADLPGCGAVVRVEDDGPGIPPEVQPRLFEPFFTTKGRKGSGLGLATVRRLIEGIGGKVTLTSALGKGTSVCILFPEREGLIVEEEVALSQATIESGPYAPAQLAPRLLFVEDQAAIRNVFARVIPRAGIELRLADCVDEALEILETFSPDLIWSDAIMPGRPTQDLISKARELGLPIVVSSGHVEEELLRRDIRTQDVEFVPKPYTAVQLIQRTRRASIERALSSMRRDLRRPALELTPESDTAKSSVNGAASVKPDSGPSDSDRMSPMIRVLLADDDRSVRRSMKRGLERHGFEVVEAENGVEAEAIYIQEAGIDAIILDANMPIRGGIETAESILRHSPTANIVMCTGFGEADLRRVPGVRLVMTKPLSIKELARHIRGLVDLETPEPPLN